MAILVNLVCEFLKNIFLAYHKKDIFVVNNYALK